MSNISPNVVTKVREMDLLTYLKIMSCRSLFIYMNSYEFR